MNTSVEDEQMKYDAEIEKLLPWYSKGLLSSEETKQVEDYLAQHPEMKVQLDLIAEEQLAIEQQHAALGAPQPGGLERLLADIDALEANEASLSQKTSSFMDGLSGFFASFRNPGVQLAAMAAALLIVAQGVVIGSLSTIEPIAPNVPGQFKTASGPEKSEVMVQGVKFLIAFNSNASLSDVAKLLKSISATITGGPKAGGFYEIAVLEGKLPEGGAEAVLKILQSKTDLVKFASISK